MGSVLKEFVNGDYKLTMWIPSDFAGKVIGKRGIVITNLQRETSTTISTVSSVGESLWLAVVIFGELKNITDAFLAVKSLAYDEVDDVVLEFNMNLKRPFFIFGGKRFQTVERISAESNVRIHLPEKESNKEGGSSVNHHTSQHSVSLEGAFNNVCRAIEFLEAEAVEYNKLYPWTDNHIVKKNNGNVFTSSKHLIEGFPHSTESKPNTVECTTSEVNANSIKNHHLGVSSNEQPKSTMESSTREHVDHEKVTPVETKTTSGRQVDSTVAVEHTTTDSITNTTEPQKKNEIEVHSGGRLEKPIDIPGDLVGLLLSKPPNLRTNILNQIQFLTKTVISKTKSAPPEVTTQNESPPVIEPIVKAAVEVKKIVTDRRRRRALSDDEDDHEEDSDEEEGDDEDDDEEDHDDEGSEGFEDALSHPQVNHPPAENQTVTTKKVDETRKVLSASGKPIRSSSPVCFITYGYREENIDLALDSIQRMIKGERIKDVMNSLKISSLKLPLQTFKTHTKYPVTYASYAPVSTAKVVTSRAVMTPSKRYVSNTFKSKANIDKSESTRVDTKPTTTATEIAVESTAVVKPSARVEEGHLESREERSHDEVLDSDKHSNAVEVPRYTRPYPGPAIIPIRGRGGRRGTAMVGRYSGGRSFDRIAKENQVKGEDSAAVNDTTRRNEADVHEGVGNETVGNTNAYVKRGYDIRGSRGRSKYRAGPRTSYRAVS